MKAAFLLLTLFSLNSVCLFSQITIKAGDVTAVSGDSVVVPITVTNFNNVGAITLKIQTNTSVLSWGRALNLSAQIQGALSGFVNNEIVLAWDDVDGADIGSGKLVDLKFKYNGGTSSIVFNEPQCEIADVNANVLPVTYINGSVSPIQTTPLVTTSLNTLPSFGDITVGQQSAPKNYTVSGSDLTSNINISAPAGFQISLSSGSGYTSSFSLSPTSGTVPQTTIYVRFSPSQVQLYSGDITHSSNGADQEYVAVTGNGIPIPPPTISLSVNSFPSFGDIVVGQQSDPKNYTISGSNLISNISVSAPDGFQISLSNGSGYANSLNLIPVGSTVNSTTIYVRFSPGAVQPYSGNISHTSTGADSKNVSVSGNGVPIATPTIVTSVNSLSSFGDITIGQQSTPKNYTVTGSDLTSNININAPAGFQISLSSGINYSSNLSLIPTNGTVPQTTIYVRFSPNLIQPFSGNITHSSTGAANKNVAVSGNGIPIPQPPTISTSVGSLPSFGDITVGQQSVPKNYTVSGSDLTSSIEINAPAGFQISLSSGGVYTSSLSLTPINGNVSSTTVYVKFNPTLVQPYSGNIIHTSTDAASKNVAVNGNGVPGFSQFTEQTSIILTGVKNSSTSWGDYDNDGDLDILLSGETDASIKLCRLYENKGNNIFQQTSNDFTSAAGTEVIWGDYNNDNFLDILSIDASVIYKNLGNGSFAEIDLLIAMIQDSKIDWGDYDNDGDLDIAITCWDTRLLQPPSCKIYENKGNDTFMEIAVLAGLVDGPARWADYDNDGDLDVLFSGFSWSRSENTIIFKNNGDGSFSNASISLLGVGESAVAWADLNNDGYIDLLVSGLTHQTLNPEVVVKLYKNMGNGTFSEINSTMTGVQNGAVTCGDYNNDGYVDILLCGWTEGGFPISKVYKNNGNEAFSESSSLKGATDGSASWGDYDNDGDLDILLSGTDGLEAFTKIYKNNNTILNTKPAAPLNLISSINGSDVIFTWNKASDNQTSQNGLNYNLVIGKVPNGVNTLPPMSDRPTGYRRVVRLGNSQSNSWTIKNLDPGTYYWSVQSIDGAFAGSQFAAEKNFTIGSLESFSELSVPVLTGVYFSSVEWGDYDNDEDLDFILCGIMSNDIKTTKVYENKGGGIFEPISVVFPGVDHSSASWGDYDNDGDLDILLTGSLVPPDRMSKIYKNLGNGNFVEAVSLLAVSHGSVSWGDFDNDGDLDILLTGSSPGNVRISKVFQNRGNDLFVDVFSMDPIANSSGEWGDYDNDGDLDIIIMGDVASDNRISKIYKNNGNGAFSVSSIALFNLGLGDIEWADINNDGYLDILMIGASNDDESFTKIYKNNGNGSFVELPTTLENIRQGSVKCGDYNNDGYADVLLTGWTGSDRITKIYKNNGNETFSETFSLTGLNGGSAAWGDHDNDKDLDIIITGYNGNGVTKIYENIGNSINSVPSAPIGLISTIIGNTVVFNWDKSTDSETLQNGLTYNLVIGTTSNGINTLSPMADRITGYRRIIQLGNIRSNSWRVEDLPDGEYFWSVQAIDNSFAGSLFAEEKQFSMPIPVELISFEAAQELNYIILKWSTATETNNMGFEIENKIEDLDWESIGFVDGKGTSAIINNYSFIDNNLSTAGIYKYRLKQIDFNGSFEYSNEITIDIILNPQGYFLDQNFPNPFNPSTKINYNLPVQSKVFIKIYDIIGNEIITLVNGTVEPGNHSVEFSADNLSAGVYIIQMVAASFSDSKKMILLK